MNRWLRILPPLAVVVVAAASFALSYVALRDVSAAVGAVPDPMAWLVPIVIDGGTIGGSAVIWAQASDGRKRNVFPFVFVGLLVVVSVVVNVNHAADTLLAQAIAALPPLVLLGSLELAAGQVKRARQVALDEQAAAAEADEQDARRNAELADARAAADAAAQETAQVRAEADRRAAQAVADATAELESDLAALAEGHELELAELTGQLDEQIARAAQSEHARSEADRRAERAVAARDRLRDGSAAIVDDAPVPPHNGNGRASTGPSDAPDPTAGRPTATSAAPAAVAVADGAGLPSDEVAAATDSRVLADALRNTAGLADMATKDAVTAAFRTYVALGGDPGERTLTADLAAALGTSPGYVRNILRDLR